MQWVRTTMKIKQDDEVLRAPFKWEARKASEGKQGKQYLNRRGNDTLISLQKPGPGK